MRRSLYAALFAAGFALGCTGLYALGAYDAPKTLTAERVVVKHPDGKASIVLEATKKGAGVYITSGNGQEVISLMYDPSARGVALAIYGPNGNLPRLEIANQGEETRIQVTRNGLAGTVRSMEVTKLVPNPD